MAVGNHNVKTCIHYGYQLVFRLPKVNVSFTENDYFTVTRVFTLLLMTGFLIVSRLPFFSECLTVLKSP